MADLQSAFPRLLGDVGGTNARWAWQAFPGAPITHASSLPASDFATIGDCIRAFLVRQSLPAPRQAAFGIATAVTTDEVRMTNHSWSFSIDALRAELGVQRLVVLNDFEALAHAVPGLGADTLLGVGGGRAEPDTALAVIGPGTGLGVSGLLPDGRGGWRVIAGEGGHVTLAAATAREACVLAALRERFGHVSAGERQRQRGMHHQRRHHAGHQAVGRAAHEGLQRRGHAAPVGARSSTSSVTTGTISAQPKANTATGGSAQAACGASSVEPPR
jgi:glucokinase